MDQPHSVDLAILAVPGNEEANALQYWLNACAYLLNCLMQDNEFNRTALCDRLKDLVNFWRTKNLVAAGDDLEDAALDLSYFGPVGKAVWYLSGRKDAQFRKELMRLAVAPDEVVGNQYLFYIAGTLAAHGYEVGFVPEGGKDNKKTPDLWAEKTGRRTWIEANAKQPKRDVDTPEKVWQLIRDVIEEKKQKFTDAAYDPGLIVADISPISTQVNTPGTLGSAPLISTREGVCHSLNPSGGLICRLYDDPDWTSRPENQNNIFAFLVQEFTSVDRSRYHLSQCLVTISRRVVRVGNVLAFPRQHQLIVHRRAETAALTELSRHVYVV